ncbi:MAG: hypothetical protein IKG30_07585 [Clostridiales bacterium]|nr:hypothetical protein [Clostridiales bacterium]
MKNENIKTIDLEQLDTVSGGVIVHLGIYEYNWIVDDETGQCLGEEAVCVAEDRAREFGVSTEKIRYEEYIKRFSGRNRENRYEKRVISNEMMETIKPLIPLIPNYL